ncbi:MAG: hypothetical protein BGO78_09755 [Chloroflexi bacterium 44-23]|nr:MAG: hypothetical protein BGO78_09755 [Chloroflexi bacterium 44-23]
MVGSISLSRLMGEASAMGMFLANGNDSRMLRPYERSHLEGSSYNRAETVLHFYFSSWFVTHQTITTFCYEQRSEAIFLT